MSIVFKAKTKEKYEEIFCYGFYLKTQKCSLLGVNQFFYKFLSFVRQLFSKLNQSRNSKKIFLGGFSSKTKNPVFGGPKWYFLKFKFQICISAFVLLCTRKLLANFHQKILIFGPPEKLLKMKTLRARRKFGFGLLQVKSYLTFS